MDTSTNRRQNELGYRYQNAPYALVSNAQYLLPLSFKQRCREVWRMYLFPVRDDDVIDVFRPPKLTHIVLDPVLILNVQETSMWLAKEPRVILDGVALGRCVDDALKSA